MYHSQVIAVWKFFDSGDKTYQSKYLFKPKYLSENPKKKICYNVQHFLT